MGIDERSRHDLFSRLEEVLGQECATVLMEHLPPVGWADVARRSDVEALAVTTKRDLEALRLELQVTKQELLATFRAEMNAQTRVLVFSFFSALIALAGVLAAFHLA